MSTATIVGILFAVTLAIQFFFPTALSSIMTGLSYGSVKAVLDTWTANRKERKKARQEAREARKQAREDKPRLADILKVGPRIRWIKPQPIPQPEPDQPKPAEPTPSEPADDDTDPIPADEANAMRALGFNRARRQERRANRRNGRR